MSEANTEIVRRVYESRDELDGPRGAALLRELFYPEVRLDMSRRVFNPAVYRGYAGLAQWLRDITEVWASFETTVERYAVAGDLVVAIMRRRGVGRKSGIPVEDRSAWIWTVRNGRVVEIRTGFEPAEALEEIGLSE